MWLFARHCAADSHTNLYGVLVVPLLHKVGVHGRMVVGRGPGHALGVDAFVRARATVAVAVTLAAAAVAVALTPVRISQVASHVRKEIAGEKLLQFCAW